MTTTVPASPATAALSPVMDSAAGSPRVTRNASPTSATTRSRVTETTAAATGEATAHLDVDFEGKKSEIAFNPDFLIDGLKNCELDTVRLEFNEKNSPGKFTLGENYIYIVMPITIDT